MSSPCCPALWSVYILMPGKKEWVLVQLGSQHKCVERPVGPVFPDYLFLVTMLLGSCKMPICNFTKKLFHRSSFMYFAFIFSEYIKITFPKGLWKFESTIFFWKCKRNVVWLVIYLFNYDSSKSTLFMLNMAFDVLLSTVFIK